MSITVGFFNKYDKNSIKINAFSCFKYIIITVIIVVLLGMVGLKLLKHNVVNKNILCLSNSICEADNIDMTKKDFVIAMNKMNSTFIMQEENENINSNKVESVDKAEVKSNEFDVTLVDEVQAISKITDENMSVKDTDSLQKINIYGITISNYSSKRNIDFKSLFSKNITLTKKSDPILVYSTHTSESYTNSERYKFDYTSTYRTRDAKYNMLSVGNILSQALNEKNMKVIFDTTPHDYGSYEIAYTNSRKTIENQLSKNERIGLAIDVHRDALGDLTNGPTVEINGQRVAKLMFVMGVGTNSYTNEYWEDNLALALQLQKLGEEMYPGLFRGMIIRNSKYNQDLIRHSFLIEVGTTGNTLEEAYFGARCLANILNKFYNN